MKQANSIYWPELDGLRFYAFMFVFISHLGLYPDAYLWNTIVNWGWIGVELFFALSGFLISYLITREIKTFGNFDIKSFFIRRSLRIWPLYYLWMIVGFFVLPIVGWYGIKIFSPKWLGQLEANFIPYLIFLGNFPRAFFWGGISPAISSLWTVSMEEQYYLAVAALRRFVHQTKTIYIICAVLLVANIAFRAYLFFNSAAHQTYYYNTLAHLDALLIGTISGMLYFEKKALLSKIAKISILPMSAMFILTLGMAPTIFSHDQSIIYLFTFFGLYFSVLIIYLINCQGLFKKILLVNKPIIFFGKISYGLYVYHKFSIISTRYLLKPLKLEGFVSYASISVLSLALTILMGYLSWTYFELWFLKRKTSFERIHTRPLQTSSN